MRVIEDSNPDNVIDEFILEGLEKLSAKYIHDNLDPEKFKNFEEYGWKRPNPPYHITTLFVNGNKKVMERPEFQSFKDNIKESILVKGLVVVEDFLMC